MQNQKYYFVAILLLFVLLSCKKEGTTKDELTIEREAIITAIQGTWQVDEVRKDNALISDFSDFTLTIEGMNYSTTNGNPVWPATGSYSFEDNSTVNDFIRLDGRLFSATIVVDELIVTIKYDPTNGARGETGVYEFTLR